MAFFPCLASSLLLVLSFPRLEWSLLAWFALVPLLTVIDGQKPWRAFRRAYLCGFLFFFLTIGFLVYVTWPGTILLVAFLSLYFGFFGMCFVYFQRLPLLPRIFVLASCWVALEFIRAHLFSGFGWVMLGHTQYKNLWLIQIADITGVYGVSFIMALVNLWLFEHWKSQRWMPKADGIVIGIVGAALIYGAGVIGQKKHYDTIRVGLVQPNVSLEDNWDEDKKPRIVAKNLQLTRQLQGKGLDLIVWPETSLPGVIIDSPSLVYAIRAQAAAMHTPIMIGSVAKQDEAYFNSAFMFGADGQKLGRYDKIRLVPFGEFLPLRPVLGWVTKIVPLDDFTPGGDYKIFTAGASGAKFSVLICFEDTLDDLRRKFSRAGAEFFVNMTNDAWFRDTRAPYLQLQAAVLSTVENHRALARAANTGLSVLVDPWGRLGAQVRDEHGKSTFIAGTAWGDLPVVREKTVYTKYGDIFTILCFLCILVAAARSPWRSPYV